MYKYGSDLTESAKNQFHAWNWVELTPYMFIYTKILISSPFPIEVGQCTGGALGPPPTFLGLKEDGDEENYY